MSMHRDSLIGIYRMRQGHHTGEWLVAAAVVCTLLLLSSAASAQTPEGTVAVQDTGAVPETSPASPLPTTPVTVNVTKNPPPVLILGVPEIDNLTCTIYGTAAPGSVNVTIEGIRWDWGDSPVPEYHEFPHSHVYIIPGSYTVAITALQSDGQNVTRTVNVSVTEPAAPLSVPEALNTSASPGPVMPANAPILTLLEPVIDGLNVTLNGNLNPGSPGITITSVLVDWDDGSITNATDLPVTHQYSATGIYTITITGNQSDGQLTTKRITLDLKPGSSGSPGPGASAPPPGTTPVFLIILATAVVVVVIGAGAQRISRRRKGAIPGHGVKKAVPSPENLPSREELGRICAGTGVPPSVLESVVRVAVDIAREGREGQAVGTSFVIGDTENVLEHSKQFVLNPFQGHPEAERQITDPEKWGHIKEFAQLDGAFIVTNRGIVEAAGRYLTADTSRVNLPGGLGSRHSSVAGITQITKSIGVVVSQSGGLISIFRGGKIVYTVNS
jgi:DNA integrity scanning protein DisA with diadenylate cyclase activity/PKD repeat protein